MRRIASRHNPSVARYRAAARREEAGVILLDGIHLVGEALDAGVRLHDIAVAADAADDAAIATILRRIDPSMTDVAIATAPVMAAMSPVRSSSPIVALADCPRADASAIFGAQPLVVVICDVQDPGNVGAIVRVAEAGGATGIVVAGTSADPFGWKALRGSMGSALRLPILVQKEPLSLSGLRQRKCRIVATAPRGGHALFEADLAGPVAILIGGEGQGLSETVLTDADERITIPMQRPVESLNAAVTAALLVYEAQRQRSRPEGRSLGGGG